MSNNRPEINNKNHLLIQRLEEIIGHNKTAIVNDAIGFYYNYIINKEIEKAAQLQAEYVAQNKEEYDNLAKFQMNVERH